MKHGAKIMIEKILRYQGNTKYICILCSSESNELYMCYALTDTIDITINKEKESLQYNRIVFSDAEKCKLNMILKSTKNDHFFHIIKIDNEKEYEHICSVVESLA